MMDVTGYEVLAGILEEAYDQAARGKGKERHANDLPWDNQPILNIGRSLPSVCDGEAYQVIKKTQEAMGMIARGELDKARHEMLGAIVYAAACVALVKETMAAPVSGPATSFNEAEDARISPQVPPFGTYPYPIAMSADERVEAVKRHERVKPTPLHNKVANAIRKSIGVGQVKARTLLVKQLATELSVFQAEVRDMIDLMIRKGELEAIRSGGVALVRLLDPTSKGRK